MKFSCTVITIVAFTGITTALPNPAAGGGGREGGGGGANGQSWRRELEMEDLVARNFGQSGMREGHGMTHLQGVEVGPSHMSHGPSGSLYRRELEEEELVARGHGPQHSGHYDPASDPDSTTLHSHEEGFVKRGPAPPGGYSFMRREYQ